MSSFPEPRPRTLRESRPLDLSSAAADVHRFVSRRVRNLDDAADIAQQALLLAHSKRGTCRGKNVSAWLFTIARHLIVDHYRARSRVRYLEVAELADTEPALRTAPDAVLAACMHRERLNCWVDCISRWLRLEEQVAVLLADVYGYRDKDSSAALGLSLPSFKLLLYRARGRLHAIAGGSCAVAGRAGGKSAERSIDGPPSSHLTRRVGLTRRLGVSELMAVRASLVNGLGL